MAKNFIWTTLKVILLHPQMADFQIMVSRLNIVLTNHSSMESLFIQLIYFILKNLTLRLVLYFLGHIYIFERRLLYSSRLNLLD